MLRKQLRIILGGKNKMPECRNCGVIFKKKVKGTRPKLCDECWTEKRCPRRKLKVKWCWKTK